MSKFVYVSYIRTDVDKLWKALLEPEFTKQYWFGVTLDSDWKVGAPWKMLFPDGRVTDAGEVLEIDPPRRLVLKWRNEFMPDLTAEGYSRATIELEPQENGTVKLSINHEIDVENSKLINAVSGGWPRIISNLKSLLETGKALAQTK
jgi:uncharacterized protein YndB with AHSA1/START domain